MKITTLKQIYSSNALSSFKVAVFALLLSSIMVVEAFAKPQKLLIECGNSCDQVASQIEQLGGEVNHQYKYIDQLAVTIEPSKKHDLMKIDGVKRLRKDAKVQIVPEDGVESISMDTALTSTLSSNETESFDLSFPIILSDQLRPTFKTNSLNVSGLHADGITGDGQIIVVMDTGVLSILDNFNNRQVCPTEQNAPTVIGGELGLVNPAPNESPATLPLFTPVGLHGTVQASRIVNNMGLVAPNEGTSANTRFLKANLLYKPENVTVDYPEPGLSTVWFVGTAPCVKIYAIKVYPDGTPGNVPGNESDILLGMERVIELKENYLAGMPSVPVSGTGYPTDPYVYDSLNITAVNMSIDAGYSLYAGHGPIEILVNRMLELGIVPVAAAGNNGSTAGSILTPGVASGAITTGAMSRAESERVATENFYTQFPQYFPPGIGAIYRANNKVSVAIFSARGPTADGRVGIDVMVGAANQPFLIATQAAGLYFRDVGSGTSGAAPHVTGAAALLKELMPNATAYQIRSALLAGADPDQLEDESVEIDHGKGAIDVEAAYLELLAQTLLPLDVGVESASLQGNFASLGYNRIQVGNASYKTRLENMLPNHTEHILIESTKKDEVFRVTFSNTSAELPPSEQNQFPWPQLGYNFDGDFIAFEIADSESTYSNTFPPNLASGLIDADSNQTTIAIVRPHEGIMRIAVKGGQQNAGRVSTDVEIEKIESNELSPATFKGGVAQNEVDEYSVNIPAGTGEVKFNLRWKNNYSAYPTDDLDLEVMTPSGDTLIDEDPYQRTSPEEIVVQSPEPGTYNIEVQGVTVWGVHGDDSSKYELRVTVDGKPLK